MKYLLLILLASCAAKSNPKETIVERQKEIQQQMRRNLDSVLALPAIEYIATDTASRMSAAREEGKRNQVNFLLQKEYDSLEIELKKY